MEEEKEEEEKKREKKEEEAATVAAATYVGILPPPLLLVCLHTDTTCIASPHLGGADCRGCCSLREESSRDGPRDEKGRRGQG